MGKSWSRRSRRRARGGARRTRGRDPEDRNLRIAPSLPNLAEVQAAMEVVAVSVQRVALRKLDR
jgi:hypothetical protein